MRHFVRTELGINTDLSAEESAEVVMASQHVRDFQITDDAIQNIRAKTIDIKWKKATRDVDSLQAAVRLASS